MNRRDITKLLTKALEESINPNFDPRIYYVKEVTFDYGTLNQVRVDLLYFKPQNNSISGLEKGNFYCFEIKSCKEDFESPNGHNFIGDYNYYVMTLETYNKVKDRIPYGVGVKCLKDNELSVVRKARHFNREKSITEMLFMMMRSSNREYLKSQKENRKNEVIKQVEEYIDSKEISSYAELERKSLLDKDNLFCSCVIKNKEHFVQYIRDLHKLNIGDHVFEPRPDRRCITEYVVTEIIIYKNSLFYKWSVLNDGIYSRVDGFPSYELGKTIFVSFKKAKSVLDNSISKLS